VWWTEIESACYSGHYWLTEEAKDDVDDMLTDIYAEAGGIRISMEKYSENTCFSFTTCLT
jgi:hypothetical protein